MVNNIIYQNEAIKENRDVTAINANNDYHTFSLSEIRFPYKLSIQRWELVTFYKENYRQNHNNMTPVTLKKLTDESVKIQWSLIVLTIRFLYHPPSVIKYDL